MAHPADPAPKAPVFAHARLTPEEADRLASMFRPSWELDDAPFTGAGALSDADMLALQGGGGIRAEVRATAQQVPTATNGNGSHAAPVAQGAPVAAAVEVPSVVLDPSLTPAPPAQPVHVASKTMMGVGASALQAAVAAAMPQPAPASTAGPASEAPRPPPSRPSQRPMAPNFMLGPPTPRAQQVPVVGRPPSASDVAYPKKSSMGLWLAIGGAAVVVLGVGIYAVASSGSSPTANPEPTATATAKPTEDKLSAVPPPPPATATAQDPPPATTAAAAPAPVPTAPVTALPVAAPPPTHFTAATPPLDQRPIPRLPPRHPTRRPPRGTGRPSFATCHSDGRACRGRPGTREGALHGAGRAVTFGGELPPSWAVSRDSRKP